MIAGRRRGRASYRCNKQRKGCGRIDISLRRVDAELRALTVARLSDPRHAEAITAVRSQVSDRLSTVLDEIEQIEGVARALSERVGRREMSLADFDNSYKFLQEDLTPLITERDQLKARAFGDGTVNVISLALPLAVEAPEPGLMLKPPRDPNDRLLSRFVLVRTVYVGALMAAVAIVLFLLAAPADRSAGASGLAQAQTLAVTSVAFFQIFYLLTCRTLNAPVRSIGWASNRLVFAGIAMLLGLQAGFVHLPFVQALVRTDDLTPTQWAIAAAAGAVVGPVVIVEKWCRRRTGRPRVPGPIPSAPHG